MTDLTHAAHVQAPADADLESIINRLIDVVAAARAMPLSASVMISRDEVLELLDEALACIPEEMRQARWMLKEREDFLAKTERQATDMIEQARVRAEHLVGKQEVVREAKTVAQRTIDEARDEARRLRLDAEDYCDQKLAQFEVVLDRLMKTTHAGREKLAGSARMVAAPPPDVMPEVDEESLFDQDDAEEAHV